MLDLRSVEEECAQTIAVEASEIKTASGLLD
jgi:hypothetical protein